MPPAAAPASENMSPIQQKLEAATMAKADRDIARAGREIGSLVDAGAVYKEQQKRAAAERDAILAWPSRIVGPMAARLGVQEPLLLNELMKAVRTFLTERSQPSANTAAA